VPNVFLANVWSLANKIDDLDVVFRLKCVSRSHLRYLRLWKDLYGNGLWKTLDRVSILDSLDHFREVQQPMR
jgi:hypothetical protein